MSDIVRESFSESTEHAYDDAFRLIESECDDVLIPFINYYFDEEYDKTAKITRLRNEHYRHNEDQSLDKRITDSCFEISCHERSSYYQLECESSGYDDSMLVKVVRYASMIAVDTSVHDHIAIRMDYPRSALLVLRNKGNPPRKARVVICTPGGEVAYYIPVILMSDYSIETVFEQKLFFLLPFYIFNMENVLKKDSISEKEWARCKQDIEKIYEGLDAAVQGGNLSDRSGGVIISMMRNVAFRLTRGYGFVSEKVGDIMNTYGVRCEWLEKYDASVAKGRAEGKADLLVSQVCRKLRKGKSIRQIAEELEEDEIRIQMICDAAADFGPDYDEKKVAEAAGALIF